MTINIEVTLRVNGSISLQRGPFPIHKRKFNENPDKEAALAAFTWIKLLRRKSGYFYDAELVKVIYDGENDITELVRKL
ncbi:hypothetical protein [Peribacillus kribbensis]|uniref:hypothetical protein n=1 Tax=Peribacillus kribbensis TaxID=356658 RepID=UPI0003FDABF1|nr:hypothetical protein [Peribacillus kribbensis]